MKGDDMVCPRCRQENPTEAHFCMKCGTALTLTCVNCQAELPTSAAFCVACGQAAAAARSGPRFTSPDAHTPRHLAEKILNSKSALEGERKQVTVLFADLKGSMELLADRDPEEARKVLDPVLERLMEAVHRYEGTVNQVMGDGIMALFGAPIAHEDHAVRACYAALHMQELVKQYAAEAFRAHGVTVRIRVGLNSGEVVVRTIRSDLRMDYTAVGQTTHLAARMEQLAPPGAIWITADTLRLAESFVEAEPLGLVPVRGLDSPVDVYEVVTVGRAKTRFQAATVRGLSQFVGRDSEIEELRSALAEVRLGHGQIVAVAGEPGVGKSRVFHEFVRSGYVTGCRTLQASAFSYGRASSYLLAVELLKSYFHLDERDDVRSVRAKVTGHLLTLDEALKDLVAPVLWLLDALPEGDSFGDLEPPQRRQRTLEAVERLFCREAGVQPLVLVLEDLHWIDAETQALLDTLAESLPSAPVLLLVNYRPEYRHGWTGRPYYRQLVIDPLPPERADELLQALVGGDSELAPLKRLLIERTEGNPFFLEESVRDLIETGVLAGKRGAYRVVKGIPLSIHAPATVQALLAERIDRLPSAERRLLQAASVIGKDAPFALLRTIAEDGESELQDHLAHLQAADFLDQTQLVPEIGYSFKHALTHEVAHGTLLQGRRLALHQRILEALERRESEHSGEDPERLARHALGAEAWAKASGYLRRAGQRTIARSSYTAAVGFLEEALQALERLPESPDTLAQAVDLRLDLRIALVPLGRYQDALTIMREAERLATRLGDRARLGYVLADICARLRNVAGDHVQAIEVGHRALTIAAEIGDRELEREALYRTGQAYFATGEFARALELFSLCVDDTERNAGLPSRFFTSWSHSWLALTLSCMGRFDDAAMHAREALRIAEAAEHPFTLVEALGAAGSVSLDRGDLDRAIEALSRAQEVVRTWDLQPWNVLARLGHAFTLAGRPQEGRDLLEGVERSATSMSSTGVGRAMQLAWLGEAYLREGQLDEAREHAKESVSLARQHRERGHEAWGLCVLGQVAAVRNPASPTPVDTAAGYYRDALALAVELGMLPLVAHCHLHLGKLLGKSEDVATATRMYDKMGMRPIGL